MKCEASPPDGGGEDCMDNRHPDDHQHIKAETRHGYLPTPKPEKMSPDVQLAVVAADALATPPSYPSEVCSEESQKHETKDPSSPRIKVEQDVISAEDLTKQSDDPTSIAQLPAPTTPDVTSTKDATKDVDSAAPPKTKRVVTSSVQEAVDLFFKTGNGESGMKRSAETQGPSRKFMRTAHGNRGRNLGNADTCGVLNLDDDFGKDYVEESEDLGTKMTHVKKLRSMKMAAGDQKDTVVIKNDLMSLHDSIRMFGSRGLKAVASGFLQKNMGLPLFPHQVTGAAFMFTRELGPWQIHGGIQADSCGMGKTVTCLAVVLAHSPLPKDLKEWGKTTLVVVRGGVLAQQWRSEFYKFRKATDNLEAIIYDPRKNLKEKKIMKNTMVIATYNQIRDHFVSPEVYEDIQEKWKGKEYGDNVSFNEAVLAKCGELLQMKWWRVMLDEGHAIMNAESRTSISCNQIMAKNRWAITATPLANAAKELWPYCRFLKFDFVGSLTDFNIRFLKGGANGLENVNHLVNLATIRRQPDDQFMGSSIMKIPKAYQSDVLVPLAPQEEVILRFLFQDLDDGHEKNSEDAPSQDVSFSHEEEEADEERETLIKSETGCDQEQSGAQAAAKIAAGRLGGPRTAGNRGRQGVSHPYTLQGMLMRENFTVERLDALVAELREAATDTKVVDVLQDAAKVKDSDLSPFSDGLARVASFKKPVYGGKMDLCGLLNLIRREKVPIGHKCPNCEAEKDDDSEEEASGAEQIKYWVQSKNCEHVYCRTHMKTLQAMKLSCVIDGCDKKVRAGEQVDMLSTYVRGAMIDLTKGLGPGVCTAGNDANGVRAVRTRIEDAPLLAGMQGGLKLPPSSKLTTAMAITFQWQKDAPNDKIIIFVDCVMSASILGQMLKGAKIPFVYFLGHIGDRAQKEALKTFEDSACVMVAGLRCAGESLNLMFANRVIIVDRWWNNTKERQAFGRVLRHGQTKTSHLVRILCPWIDPEIQALQESKAVAVDYTMQDDKHGQVSIEDKEYEAIFSPAPMNGEAPNKARKRIQAKPKAVDEDDLDELVPQVTEAKNTAKANAANLSKNKKAAKTSESSKSRELKKALKKSKSKA